MKKYTVLWIDDEAENQDAFLDSAYLEGIEINYFKTSKLGMEELTSKIEQYDAVILDAMVYNESEDEKAGLAGLQNSINIISSLSDSKKIPYFIFSGYIDKNEHSSAREMLAKETIFIKSKDNQALFEAIKEAANSQIDTQLKHENQRLFEVLNAYPEEVRNTFLSILKGLGGPVSNFDDQLYFTQLRIILEHLFRKANAIGLLHDECVQKNGSQVNLSECSLFLSGKDTKHLNVTCSVTHFPKVIADNIKNIIHITGAASHTSLVDVTKNMDIQEYRKDIKTPYLLYSLTFQIMDAIIWFDGYSKINNDIELNKSNWKFTIPSLSASPEDWISGEIIKIEDGWITFQPDNGGETISVPPKFVDDNMTQGQTIKIIAEPSPDGTKKHTKEVKTS